MNLLDLALEESKEYNLLEKYLKEKKSPIFLTNMLKTQKCHIISKLFKKEKNFNLVICENDEKAKELYENLKFFEKDNVLFYPSKDIIFYNANIKSKEILKDRFNVINNIINNKKCIIVLAIEALFNNLVKKDIFENAILNFKVGDIIDLEELAKTLVFIGYEKYDIVESYGQFSIRGGIIDIFSPTSSYPLRIELFDDEVDSIRSLDYVSQRSIKNIEEATIFPMKELIYNQSTLNTAIKNLKAKATEENSLLLNEIIEKLENQKTFSGIENYFQFFYEDKTNLIDYLEQNSIIYFDNPNKIKEYSKFLEDEFLEILKEDIENKKIIACEKDIIFTYEEILNITKKFPQILMVNIQSSLKDFAPQKTIDFNVKSSFLIKNNEDKLVELKKMGYMIVLVCTNSLKCERLEKEFNEKNLQAIFLKEEKLKQEDYQYHRGILYIVRGNLKEGFEYPDEKFIVITDDEILLKEKRTRKKNKKYLNINNFTDLKIGDYIVHENHGIAIFEGIEKITTEGITKDYLKLVYADEGVLYVSVNQMENLQKYISTNAKPKLSKLGTKQWTLAKNRVKEEVKEFARKLIRLYAKRENSKGFMYSKDTIWQSEFEENFPFDETEDQIRAIEEVKKDMESQRVMDRLICGDVGFGKTEVAIRASFKAVQDNKQVVFLVPTTILSQQHFNTISERMKDYPIKVEMLSRFRTPKQQKNILEDLKKGKIDIIVATHRILSKDIEFKDLGLIIVDEEQRFGVKHKEKFKGLKENIDILTLSATPIPRTLHMSLAGIRSMSTLEEPPKERIPIQTYVLEYEESSIKHAIKRELSRKGQVYYLHNQVKNIEKHAEKIQNLVPNASVAFAHGQMSERNLEDIMLKFMNNEINVLVCTTIIETGIDIPNVNTIIINDADKMGLSQLYQLKGRVGRSNKVSYAYLTYKKDKVLNEISEKRLQTIKEFTEFGSGFKIAMRDLEIRGSGNLLGQEQHGHMDTIGYELYCKILNRAIKIERGEEEKEDFETFIDIAVNAFIPNRYIENESQRLEMYKKISLIKNEEDFLDIQDELQDKFGDIPKIVLNLLEIALMKAFAHNIGIYKIAQNSDKIFIYFNNNHNVSSEKITHLLKNSSFKFNGNLIYLIKDNKENFVNKLKDTFYSLKE